MPLIDEYQVVYMFNRILDDKNVDIKINAMQNLFAECKSVIFNYSKLLFGYEMPLSTRVMRCESSKNKVFYALCYIIDTYLHIVAYKPRELYAYDVNRMFLYFVYPLKHFFSKIFIELEMYTFNHGFKTKEFIYKIINHTALTNNYINDEFNRKLSTEINTVVNKYDITNATKIRHYCANSGKYISLNAVHGLDGKWYHPDHCENVNRCTQCILCSTTKLPTTEEYIIIDNFKVIDDFYKSINNEKWLQTGRCEDVIRVFMIIAHEDIIRNKFLNINDINDITGIECYRNKKLQIDYIFVLDTYYIVSKELIYNIIFLNMTLNGVVSVSKEDEAVSKILLNIYNMYHFNTFNEEYNDYIISNNPTQNDIQRKCMMWYMFYILKFKHETSPDVNVIKNVLCTLPYNAVDIRKEFDTDIVVGEKNKTMCIKYTKEICAEALIYPHRNTDIQKHIQIAEYICTSVMFPCDGIECIIDLYAKRYFDIASCMYNFITKKERGNPPIQWSNAMLVLFNIGKCLIKYVSSCDNERDMARKYYAIGDIYELLKNDDLKIQYMEYYTASKINCIIPFEEMVNVKFKLNNDTANIVETTIHKFICPITHHAFIDPVIAEDGFTYERNAIVEHFKTKKTSPITNVVLSSTNVIPNMYVRTDIQDTLGIVLPPTNAGSNTCDKNDPNKKTYIEEIIKL